MFFFSMMYTFLKQPVSFVTLVYACLWWSVFCTTINTRAVPAIKSCSANIMS